MVKHIQASTLGVISTPESPKNLTWNPICRFGVPNNEKVTNMTSKRVPKGSLNPSQIDKNRGLDPKVSSGVSLGTPGSPKWSLGIPKWSHQASQIAGLGTKNLPILQNASPTSPAIPASLTNYQLTGCQRGRRQGAKPLR